MTEAGGDKQYDNEISKKERVCVWEGGGQEEREDLIKKNGRRDMSDH